MGARALLLLMVLGAGLAIWAMPSPSEPAPAPEPAHADVPWLTPEAAAQIIGEDGGPGPVFAGVILGGAEPPPEIRAHIAEFARANDVKLELEIVHGNVAAIRFDVTFGGCCGYEGADVLALRLARPRYSACCGCEWGWVDDWSRAVGDRVEARVRVRVNRVQVRWEAAVAIGELLARADQLLDDDPHAVAKREGDRWSELATRRYRLEVPFAFVRYPELAASLPIGERRDLGLDVRTERGRIVEVTIPQLELEMVDDLPAELRARWGRPSVADEDTWIWRKPDRVITADRGPWSFAITIRATATEPRAARPRPRSTRG
ncbi:MAG TPA: hypothetical protein VFQ53_27860 [Kofleriaceae bacterium]|nr:hypothetical protein [Kofleriaceae bacterium]